MTRVKKNAINKIRERILKDYVAGLSIREIMEKYHYKYPRIIYYHLGELTDELKFLHGLNSLKRRGLHG